MIALYIKLRGRIHGPFDETKLRSMIQKGQLSRIHQVSQDQEEWCKAGDFKELFSVTETANEVFRNEPDSQQVSNQAANPAQPQANQPEPTAAQSISESTAETNRHWYYGDGTNPIGPVDEKQIKQFVSAGTLSRDTLVWSEGMVNWMPLESVPELSAPAPNPATPTFATSHIHVHTGQPQVDQAQGTVQTHGSDSVPQNIVNSLAGSRGWMLFVAILFTIMAGCYLIYAIYLLIQGIKYELEVLVGAGIGNLITAICIMVGCIFLYSIANQIQKLRFTPRQSVLFHVVEGYRNFWIYVSWVLIAVISLTILGTIVIVAMAT